MVRYVLIQAFWLLLPVAAILAFYKGMYCLGILALLSMAVLIWGVFDVRLSMYCKNRNRLKKTDKKQIALTFDDAPTGNTDKILDILKMKNVPATFFCIGRQARENPVTVKRMQAEGHVVGTHSEHHKSSYAFKGIRKVHGELESGKKSLSRLLNEPVQLFRLPFGVSNPVIGYNVKKIGLQSIGWTVRSLDTRSKSAEVLRKKILRKVKPGSIVLLHDYVDNTVTMLPQLIDELNGLGYQFVVIK